MSPITLLLNFVKTNYIKILLAFGLSFLFYIIFYLTTLSLRKLKLTAFNTYPFDTFFPGGGTWSVGYFIIIILLFGLMIFLLMSGGFYISPA